MIGLRDISSTKKKGKFYCVECNKETEYQLVHARRYLTFMFVPLIAIKKIAGYVECCECKVPYREEFLSMSMQEVQASGQQKKWTSDYLAALKRVMIAVAASSGDISEKELQRIQRVYEKITKKPLAQAELRQHIQEVVGNPNSLDGYLPQIVPTLNESAKLMILSAAMEIAAADGSLQQQEQSMIKNIGRLLELPRAKIKEVVGNYFNIEELKKSNQELTFRSKSMLQRLNIGQGPEQTNFNLGMLPELEAKQIATTLAYNLDMLDQVQKQVECIEKLEKMLIAKNEEVQRQKRRNRLYLVASFLTFFLGLGGAIAYYEYGLSNQQREYFRERLANSALGRKILEYEEKLQHSLQKLHKTEEDLQQTNQNLTQKVQEVKQKEQIITQTQQEVIDKEKQLSQKQKEVLEKQQTLELKAYIAQALKEINDYLGTVEQQQVAVQQAEQQLREAEKLLRGRQDEIGEGFNQLPMELFNDLGSKYQEKLLITKAELIKAYEADLAFLGHGIKTCQSLHNQGTSVSQSLKETQDQFLNPAKKVELDLAKRDFAQTQKLYQEQQAAWQNLPVIQNRLKTFSSVKIEVYQKILKYNQRRLVNQKSFQTMDREFKEIKMLQDSLVKFADKEAFPNQLKQIEKLRGEIESLHTEIRSSYQQFSDKTTDGFIVTDLQSIALDDASTSRLTQIQGNIERREQELTPLMDKAQQSYSQLSKIAKSYVEMKSDMEEEVKQRELAHKKATETIAEPLPLPPLTTTPTHPKEVPRVEQPLPTAEPTVELIFNNIQSFFRMSPCEFTVKGSTFEKKSDKLTLKTYSIFKIYSQIYESDTQQSIAILVQTLAPQNEAGNRILKRDNIYWYYNREQDSIIRVTPGQQLENAIDIVDIAAISYKDYNPDKQLEKVTFNFETLYRIVMRARFDQQFPVINCLYSPAKSVPLKFECYNRAGQLNLVIYCKSFQSTGLGRRIKEYVVVDSINNLVVQLEYLNVVKKEFPDYMFKKDYLKQISKE